jgi:hypothetical protein
VGLTDLTAFNFVDISIFPHYHDKLKSDVEGYQEKIQHTVYALTDQEVVLVKGDTITKIG